MFAIKNIEKSVNSYWPTLIKDLFLILFLIHYSLLQTGTDMSKAEVNLKVPSLTKNQSNVKRKIKLTYSQRCHFPLFFELNLAL